MPFVTVTESGAIAREAKSGQRYPVANDGSHKPPVTPQRVIDIAMHVRPNWYVMATPTIPRQGPFPGVIGPDGYYVPPAEYHEAQRLATASLPPRMAGARIPKMSAGARMPPIGGMTAGTRAGGLMAAVKKLIRQSAQR